jgi:hypothetical protein
MNWLSGLFGKRKREKELEEDARRRSERGRARGAARIWECGNGEGSHARRLGMEMAERCR